MTRRILGNNGWEDAPDMPLKTEDQKAQEALNTLLVKRTGLIVTCRQAKLALRQVMLLQDVIDYLNGLPETTTEDIAIKQDAMIEWETASVFKRLHPLVISLMPVLGMNDSELDDFFIWAGGFE